MRHPGDLAVAPPVLLAVGLLLVNDHVLKARWGNALTGKLSDVAGVFIFPLIALSVIEVGRCCLRRRSWMMSSQEVVGAVAVTAIGFAAVKLLAPIGDAYATVIGAIRWAGRAMVGAGTGLRAIEVTRDWTDVLVLPVLLGSVAVARSRRWGGSPPARFLTCDGHTSQDRQVAEIP